MAGYVCDMATSNKGAEAENTESTDVAFERVLWVYGCSRPDLDRLQNCHIGLRLHGAFVRMPIWE